MTTRSHGLCITSLHRLTLMCRRRRWRGVVGSPCGHAAIRALAPTRGGGGGGWINTTTDSMEDDMNTARASVRCGGGSSRSSAHGTTRPVGHLPHRRCRRRTPAASSSSVVCRGIQFSDAFRHEQTGIPFSHTSVTPIPTHTHLRSLLSESLSREQQRVSEWVHETPPQTLTSPDPHLKEADLVGIGLKVNTSIDGRGTDGVWADATGVFVWTAGRADATGVCGWGMWPHYGCVTQWVTGGE